MARMTLLRTPAKLLGLVVAVSACLAPAEDSQNSVAAAQRPSPETALQGVEDRLLAAVPARVDFKVTASGAIEANLIGRLLLGANGQARLEGSGSFAESEVRLLLVSDGNRMMVTNGADSVLTESPRALREALVLGLTRMGIMHNLARLTEAAPPDHAEGGVGEWVRTIDIRSEGEGNITFELEVAGVESASVTLLMAPTTELPGERIQTVRFSDGDFEVRELYEAIAIGAAIDPTEFVLH